MLAQKGLDPIGVDPSALMLAAARRAHSEIQFED